ncbi:MAG TPA: phosphoribosylglycinamide formyltransferase [Gaiellaceae bacterium]|nr:phosphoribosylglycinamide formyltransferase [Gaiellaceae bacterium]
MIGVLVSGAGTNLQALLDAELPVRAVASNRAGAPALARAAGLPTAAFELAEYASRAERDAAMAAWLEAQGVELVVLAGYMHILTPAFLGRFPGRVINVHPSLLPDFPGAHAVADQLAAGVAESGVTVHVVDEGVDTGPILLQERVAVHDGDTVETLHARIKQVEHRLLPQAIEGLLCAR